MHRTRAPLGADGLIGVLDENRKSLLHLIDRFFHPSVICAHPGATCARIEDAIRIVGRNLKREERLMARAAYPGYAVHKREHESLLGKLSRMRHTLVCGAYDNAVPHDYLTEWAGKHAAAFDKPFGDFLRRRVAGSSGRRGG